MSITKQSFDHTNMIAQTADNSGLSEDDTTFALQYLDHYYINPDVVTKFDTDAIAEAVRQFQANFGLPVTGEIDTATIKAMKYTPRCGCPDYKSSTDPQAAKWGGNKLTYFFESYVNGLSQTDQIDLAKMALNQWAAVCNLTFEQVSSKSQARLIFSTGRGASDNFDGPSNTLAWAYLPQSNAYSGQLLMKFDLDETWIKNSMDRGILYLNVACHEFGHMLGLEHSSSRQALMAPTYAVGVTKPQANDDIPRIQQLYGQPLTPVGPTTPTTPTTPVGPTTPTARRKVEIWVNSMDDIKIDGKAVANPFDLI